MPPARSPREASPGAPARRGLEGLTVLSLEQALTLPFLTFRLACEGMRVIRIESPRHPDPNRAIGEDVLREPGREPRSEPGMGSYFLPYNAGKQSVSLDLSTEAGRALLLRLVERLPADVFALNTLPRNWAKLGVDEGTLRRVRTDLVWLSITGFGPGSDEPAYDPVLQARLGWMDLTGEPDGPPQVFGLPMVDLGAAEHAYGALLRALLRRATTGEGSRVDVSMARSALSWMAIPLGLASAFGTAARRRGNTHPFFGPVAVYETRDGPVYLAVGSDAQWERLVARPVFAALRRPEWRTNAGRMAAGTEIHGAVRDALRPRTTEEALSACREAGVPAARVATIPEVLRDPLVAAGERVRSRDPRTGIEISVPPPPVPSEWLRARDFRLPFPPRLGEHTEAVLRETGGTA